MNEIDEYTQELMLKFLQNNFPVKKLKDGRRFRRGIIMDNGFTGSPTNKLFLAPQSELNQLGIQLCKVLEDVFGVPRLEINMVILKYLKVI